MKKYLDIFLNGYSGYWNYLKQEVLQPAWDNYFYWLIALSVAVWCLELLVPWRKSQRPFRRDFWLDGFYMFFNFFLFSLVLYNGISNVAVEFFNDMLAYLGVKNVVAINIQSWPLLLRFGIAFLIADFIQWNVHRMLHRVPWMWNLHKVHHSVKEMGFAAHLRFHWMETIIYKTVQYIPLAIIGFGIADFFIIHIIAVAIGHLNHANLGWSYGPFKYILNNPRMHIWHHSKDVPANRKYGMNYGISLSIWDYVFGTAYIPKSGKDIELGFEGDEVFPKSFFKQIVYPLGREKKN